MNQRFARDNEENEDRRFDQEVKLAIGSQTDPGVYIRFACNMFLSELDQAIREEKECKEIKKFQELLKQAEWIVNRIKSKAAGSHGLYVSREYGNAVHAMSPMTPTLGAGTERAWHFDVSSPNRGSGSPQKTKRVHELRSSKRGNSTKRGQSNQHTSRWAERNSISLDLGAPSIDAAPSWQFEGRR